MRSLSHSELSTLFDCPAAHDFAYVGTLVGGGALVPKTAPLLLRQGRAWGAAVAAWHATGDVMVARQAALDALDEDAREQQAHGLYLPDEHAQVQKRLVLLLAEYVRLAERLPLDRPEHELHVPIPSRTRTRRSNRYALRCFIDGVHVDEAGRTWLVEFKLRGQLTPSALIALGRQTRWYAWAWREQYGVEPAGVIVDERLRDTPKPARRLQNGRASHDKAQATTPELYDALCAETETEPDPEARRAFAARRWQAQTRVLFRADELDEVGAELVSAARLVHQYDVGLLRPVRNPSRSRCPGCRFRDVCPDPTNAELVAALFTRAPAKRNRPQEVACH